MHTRCVKHILLLIGPLNITFQILQLLIIFMGVMLQITKGLLDKYGPDRVLDTPITEVH